MKKIISSSVICALLLGTTPAGVFAIEATQKPATTQAPTVQTQEKSPQAQKAVTCERMSTIASKQQGRVDEKSTVAQGKRDELTKKRSTNRAEVDTKRQKARTEADTKLATEYESLTKLAKTDEQKLAVGVFRDTVAAAQKTRRAAVDAAATKYRTSVDELMAKRQSSAVAAATSYKTQVQAAAREAYAQCTQTGSFNLDTYKKQLEERRVEYRSSILKLNNKQELQALRDTRNKEFETSRKQMQDAIAQAVATLRTALTGVKSDAKTQTKTTPEASTTTPKATSSPQKQ